MMMIIIIIIIIIIRIIIIVAVVVVVVVVVVVAHVWFTEANSESVTLDNGNRKYGKSVNLFPNYKF